MKTKFVFLQILLFSACILVPSVLSLAQSESGATSSTRQPDLAEVMALVTKLEQATSRAIAEAEASRKLNEELVRRLEKNTAEVQQLRQRVNELTAQLGKGQGPVVETRSAEQDLAKTVEKLEEQTEMNSAQLREFAQTKVETDSRTRLKVFGLILANTYFNSSDSSLNDDPQFALPATANSKGGNAGSSMRQTRLGLLFNGPRIGANGPRVSAEATMDFWGGGSGDVTGYLRLVTASVRLDFTNTSIIAGQRELLISPRNPHSLAAVWLPEFAMSGNLWQWRPQIEVEHRIKAGDTQELNLAGGVILPFGETVQGNTLEGGPGYEVRAGYKKALENDRSLEFGFGAYYHARTFPAARKLNSYAYTADWHIPFTNRLSLSGEAYAGRANGFSEFTGGRADRVYSLTGAISDPRTLVKPVFSIGGWSQLSFKAFKSLDLNLGYGQEDPRNRDIFFGNFSASTRFKNQSLAPNFIWSIRQNVMVSVEYRRMWTQYLTATQRAGHLNLAIGYTF